LILFFYHELSEFKLPLSKNPEYLVFRQNLPSSSDKKTMGEEATCELFSSNDTENPPQGDISEESGSWEIDENLLIEFFTQYIEPKINTEMQPVRIFRNENGGIIFEGEARFGKILDREKALAFVKKAITDGVTRIELPIKTIPPVITVEDEQLQEMGIKDLVSVGESDFSGSTYARMQNIEVGAERFNGFLIPQGEVASFNDQLGPVGPAQGYVPELVILGPKVDKEYGGGLCQVSSTAFRSALLAGVPIVERYPHSFAVSYYEPWGTDATIYPGSKDLKFENDTEGALLMQTVMDRETKKLRFLLYGTKDERRVKMFGPQIGKHRPPLAPRHETSPNIPTGEVQRLSAAVPGFEAEWIRVVIPDIQQQNMMSSEEDSGFSPFFYRFLSQYKPRGDWTVTGSSSEQSPAEGSTI
jgi:vancomycin resistance protein YoaR